jgi:hypothetical protein
VEKEKEKQRERERESTKMCVLPLADSAFLEFLTKYVPMYTCVCGTYHMRSQLFALSSIPQPAYDAAATLSFFVRSR